MDKYVEFWYTRDKEKIEEYKYLIMLNLDSEELKKLSKKDKVVSKYMDQLELINKLPKYRGFISEEEDNRKIMNSLKDQYTKEGKRKGIEEKSIEIAKSLLENGVDVETICKSTGLSTEEINNLK